MSGASGLIWGVVIVTAALMVLCAGVIVSLSVHNRKMRESEQRFRLLFERAFDTLMLTDAEGAIVDINQAACKLLGYEKEDFMGLPIANFLHEDDTGYLKIAMKKVLSKSNEMVGEVILKDIMGRQRHFEGAVGHFEFLESHYLIVSFRDLTERIEAAQALMAERQNLYEKNVALKEVLHHIEEEKTEIRHHVAEKIEQTILPLLKRLALAKGAIDGNYYTMLLEELRGLSGFSGSPSLYFKLTPREIEICDLIRTGASTKDIAKALNISITTSNQNTRNR